MSWIPRFCVINDFKKIIPNQHVKFMDEVEQYNEKTGKTYLNKVLVEDIRDIKIEPLDGAAINSLEMELFLRNELKTDERITSHIFRLPYAKGCSHTIDFKKWFAENGITHITDMWGTEWDVNELDMILTESTFKGSKYFDDYGDSRDFDNYLFQCEKYDHTYFVCKWNEQPESEKIYTRANYQILQDLDVPFEEFKKLAGYSKAWGESIAKGFDKFIWCFAGLTYKHNLETGDIKPPGTDDVMCKAILKNPDVLNDPHIIQHFRRLAEKYFDEFGCGKIFLKSAFKIACPDLIAFMEHAAGMEVKGALKAGEIWSRSLTDGVFIGEHILERNPHIAKSEHCIVTAIGEREDSINRYCGHLHNVVMINIHDITCARLSGMDFDGDIVLVIDSSDYPAFRNGINKDLPVVINIDEKATAVAERIGDKALIHDILFGADNRIGEYSNCATKWNNKVIGKDAKKKDGRPYTDEERKKFQAKCDDYVNLIAIINAKEIDSAKTHIKVNIPSYIQKYAGPYPYFMRYAGEYYAKIAMHSKDKSNMNQLAWDIEKWKRGIMWQKSNDDKFSYQLYIDPELPHDEERFEAMHQLFLEYCKRGKEFEIERKEKRVDFERKWLSKIAKGRTKVKRPPMHLFQHESDYVGLEAEMERLAREIEPNDRIRANYVVAICYTMYPSRPKKFAWLVAGEGIVNNIAQTEHQIPMQTFGEDADFKYLGRKMKWVNYPPEFKYDEEGCIILDE